MTTWDLGWQCRFPKRYLRDLIYAYLLVPYDGLLPETILIDVSLWCLKFSRVSIYYARQSHGTGFWPSSFTTVDINITS
jgi:hypothetical protein